MRVTDFIDIMDDSDRFILECLEVLSEEYNFPVMPRQFVQCKVKYLLLESKGGLLALAGMGKDVIDVLNDLDESLIKHVVFFDSYKSGIKIRQRNVKPLNSISNHKFERIVIGSQRYFNEISECVRDQYHDINDCPPISPLYGYKSKSEVLKQWYLKWRNSGAFYTSLVQRVERMIYCSSELGKEVIVFILPNANPGSLRTPYYAKALGYSVVIVFLHDDYPVPDQDLSFFCDDYLSVSGNILKLFDLVAHIQPYLVHVMAFVTEFFLTWIIKNVARVPVVSDFYDLPYTLISTEQPPVSYKDKLNHHAAYHIIKESSGIVYKDSPEALVYIKNQTKIASYQLHLPVCTCADFQSTYEHSDRDKGPPLRIVYVGGVHNYETVTSIGRMLDTAKKLTGQGLCFSIYNAVHNDSIQDYKRFYELEKSCDYFQYHKNTPYHKLSASISGYDIGWFVMNFEGLKIFKHELSLASKLFSYVDANLPVLICPEHRFMANIIERYDIGMVVSFSDINVLSEVITLDRISAWKENIRYFRSVWDYRRYLDDLDSFYKSVSNSFYRILENQK